MGGVVWVTQNNDQIDRPSTVVHIPLGSRFFEVEGTDVGEIKGSILRSGCE